MARLLTGQDVYRAAIDRLSGIYKAGHRVVISFSGGKDSTVCLELCIEVAKKHGRLPVEVIIQEEVAYPGTYEFVERVANRKEVSFTWLVMQQPMINVYNRELPFFWVMDPLLPPEKWVRKPPAFAEFTEERAIETMVNSIRYPVEYTPVRQDWDQNERRQMLVNVIGLRAQESAKRAMGMASSSGYMTGGGDVGVAGACRPIYDWRDGDVWKFIKERRCDVNSAYNVMLKMGIPGRKLRCGPPTMNIASVTALQVAARAWPGWFDRVCDRCPGVRLAANFGARVVKPYRRVGETWQQTFVRECIDEAPEWIKQRSIQAMDVKLRDHAHHAKAPFPEVEGCPSCGNLGSWKILAGVMWGGDPYMAYTTGLLPLIQPEDFRKGAGTWTQFIEGKVERKVRIMQ